MPHRLRVTEKSGFTREFDELGVDDRRIIRQRGGVIREIPDTEPIPEPTVEPTPAPEQVAGIEPPSVPVEAPRVPEPIGEAPAVLPPRERFVTDLQPIVEERSLIKEFDTDPEGFINELIEFSSEEEIESTLLSLGLEKEQVDSFAFFVELGQAVETVFPEMGLGTFQELVQNTPEDFIDRIQTGGRTKEKQDLLRSMGLTWQEINDIFGVQKLVLNIEGIRQQVTVLPDNSVVDKDGVHLGTYSYTTKEFTPYEYQIADTWKAIEAGEGSFIAVAGSTLKWMGAEGIGTKLTEFGDFPS